MNQRIRNLKDQFRRARHFVMQDIWRIGKPGEEIPSGLLIKQVRVLFLLLTKLLDGHLMLRASALTFATLLSIVPILAVIFYIIQTFNLGEEVYANIQTKLENAIVASAEKMPGLGTHKVDDSEEDSPDALEAVGEDDSIPEDSAVPEEVTPDTEEDTTSVENTEEDANAPPKNEENQALQDRFILQFSQGVGQQNDDMENPVEWLVDLSNTLVSLADEAAQNKAAFGISTIVLILTTVFGLMKNIEKSFNSVWGVRRTRSWYRMMSDYLVITIALPFVMAGVLGVSAALQSERVLVALGPMAMLVQSSQFFLIVLVFTGLYYVVPNTRVRLGYALFGGIMSGTLWILLTWFYIHFQVGLAKYQAVLSVFAQFPMLLMWIYSSWAILLFGSEITYAYQNEKTFAMERFADQASFAYRAALGLRAIIEVGSRFQHNEGPLHIESAALEWNVPSRLLTQILEQLEESGFITECATDPISYQPARPLDRIRAGDILQSLHERGEDPSLLLQDDAYRDIFEEYLNPSNGIHATTIADMIVRVAPAVAKPDDAE